MKKAIFLFLLFLVVLLLPYVSCRGQELPPISNYPSNVYGAGTQNWSISQASNKYIYVANNDGLLEHNGTKWTLFPSPNGTIMRSVACKDDTLFTGSYMDFGFWEKNEAGLLVYQSLIKNLALDVVEDEQFWGIIPYENWVLFQSLNRIYIYNTRNEKVDIISSTNTINHMFNVGGVIYFQVANEGLYKIQNSLKALVSDATIFKQDVVVGLVESSEGIRVITRTSGFYTLVNTSLNVWNTEINTISRELSIYTSIALGDGTLMIGTISNGVYHVAANGDVLFEIKQNTGLSDNTALTLFEDQDSNVWAGLDNGIDCINMNASFTNYIDRRGRLGTTYASIIFNDILYLGTNQGLFYKSLNKKDDFKLLKGTEGQVWYLKQIGNSLLCGHDNGTFQIEKELATLISSIRGAWILKEVPNNPSLLLQGTYNGLYTLKKEGANWKLKDKVDGFNISSRYLEFADEHKILVSHEYKGVYKLELNSDFSKVISRQKDTSVTKGPNSSIVSFDGFIYYANEKGVYRYDPIADAFIINATMSSIFSNNKYVSGKLINENNEKLWMFNKNGIVFVDKIPLNDSFKVTEIPITFDLRNEKKGYENISKLSSDTYLMGTSNGYLLFDINAASQNEYTVFIDNVSVGVSKERVLSINKFKEHDFESKQNSFLFEFSVPEYSKYITTQYQYMLEGSINNDQWNEWTSNASIYYENLNYGSYVFKVRTKVNNQIQKKTASYDFEIERPWYVTNYAKTAYTLLLLLFFIVINAWYKQNYKKQNKRLLEESTREISLKELENQRQLIGLENQKLQQDIENKNRELAISTMSLIKKNEFLSTLKKELKNDSKHDLKGLIKIIDKNLNNTDDWKLFEEAFNNADKDFLKKMKTKHPLFTPNDLRLCAYLRLNLSSKEIAPLLNISPRSVEVKRYRLRKKMELPHESSLTNYILEI